MAEQQSIKSLLILKDSYVVLHETTGSREALKIHLRKLPYIKKTHDPKNRK